jgi:hypothetical protein
VVDAGCSNAASSERPWWQEGGERERHEKRAPKLLVTRVSLSIAASR